ncbi:MAG: flagellar basal body-associated FliL family protein [Treponema sp.]|nr:flagellar basal body-associated FliL family protein [Candidatus Treponema equi]
MKTKLEKLNTILLAIAGIIAAALIISTATVFAINGGKPEKNYRRADPDPRTVTNMNKGSEENVDAFTDFRQIRVQTKVESEDEEPSVVVVSPWFSYPAGDQQLFEELSQKERQMRAIFNSYFTSHTSDEIQKKGEAQIKEELKDEINSQLVMGKIRAVYFNEYIFIN